MKKPCSDCPFLKKGGIRLTQARVKEIAEVLLDSQGKYLTCHKTTVEDDETGEMVNGPNATHCAGALIFAERNGNATQIMRIMERLGAYDAKALMSQKKVVASVFSTTREMLAANGKTMH